MDFPSIVYFSSMTRISQPPTQARPFNLLTAHIEDAPAHDLQNSEDLTYAFGLVQITPALSV